MNSGAGEKIVRLKQSKVDDQSYRVDIETKGFGQQQPVRGEEFEFELTARDQEDIRWYLEDYLLHPFDPAPSIAERIEKRMEELGSQLFRGVFLASGDARERWRMIKHALAGTRIEMLTTVESTTVPWELLRDPDSGMVLALNCRSFVRASFHPKQSAKEAETESGSIRILLAICRPGKSQDVPFRSVASRLIRSLGETERESFQLDVLRPATFESLGERLHNANKSGRPYHVLHFDGHGDFLDAEMVSASSIHPDQSAKGRHGYLFFERPDSIWNMQLVGGEKLGQLLSETNVPVLVLNACRSAHAEPPEKPEEVTEGKAKDLHSQIRAYGSLAQELVDAGVAGVVAMRHSVFVYTAAEFVANLYAALSRGRTLGEAVTGGRKHLSDNPLRTIAFDARRLEDWSVPQVFESFPIQLFPQNEADGERPIELSPERQAVKDKAALDKDLPPPPDVGFFGRDETLLALDRAFDTQSIVLLHAYAGSGKTATAVEFVKWYKMTGGVTGPVLFSKFEHKLTLSGVLSHFGEVLGAYLQKNGVQWLAITDEVKRRRLALRVLEQIPVLWIWDNIESVMGFPTGAKSEWNREERDELLKFLREASRTKAKFLLTSRRDEREWLKDLPFRITVPPMPMQERLELARALAERRDKHLPEIADWRPLLRFTEGNPLTITVVVGQALRDGLEKKEQIETFVEKLRAGEAEFSDDETEDRSRSLGASLRYGFERAFTREEQKIIALLHLFQEFVDVNTLILMGTDEVECRLHELKDLTRERGIELLDRAAEIGLLTAITSGYYSIHPAVPWFLKSLFESCYPFQSESEISSAAEQAVRAFTHVVGRLGNYYLNQFADGRRDLIHKLIAEEANLLFARNLAMENKMWRDIIGAMQGLQILYHELGDWSDWRGRVDEILPYFVDPETNEPLPGLEEHWSIVTQYQVGLALNDHDPNKAESLRKICVEWDRKQAAPLLEIPPDQLNGEQRDRIQTLAASLHEFGRIQRDRGRKECVQTFEESLRLSQRIGTTAGAAICAFSLGQAFIDVSSFQDLDKAEKWSRRSLELYDEQDRIGRACCLYLLGDVALERLRQLLGDGRPEDDVLLVHLNNALNHYKKALDLFPPTSIDNLGLTHGKLGTIYTLAENLPRAQFHYEKSILCAEIRGNVFGAAEIRAKMSAMFAQAGQFSNALAYAKAALANFESYGDRAADQIEKTSQYIAQIEMDLARQNREKKE